jgi:Fe-S-cluster containining protein
VAGAGVSETFGGCASCRGECCRRYVVPLFVADVRAIIRATALHPAEFLVLAEATAGIPGFRLGPDGAAVMPVLHRRPVTGACVFLMQLTERDARCGAYPFRPTACRTFPTTLRHGAPAVREGIVCGTDAWNIAAMDLPGFHRDLTAQEAIRAEHARVVDAWNIVDEVRTPADLLAHLHTACT